jgi:hypothetical protein
VIPLIFLDFDGVLNNRRSMHASWGFGVRPHDMQLTRTVDPFCVSLLNRIIELTGAGFVVSSTWRLYHPETIPSALAWGGFKHRNAYFGQTPSNGDSRGSEIAEWLVNSPDLAGGPYCILDDDSDFLDEQRPFHVKTNHEVGLTVDDALKAVAILRGTK